MKLAPVGVTLLTSITRSAMNELDITFAEIVTIIEESRANAYRKVNEELILMYQKIGRFLSEKTKDKTRGDSYIKKTCRVYSTTIPWHKRF